MWNRQILRGTGVAAMNSPCGGKPHPARSEQRNNNNDAQAVAEPAYQTSHEVPPNLLPRILSYRPVLSQCFNGDQMTAP
jgi:hypothetical protein